jgi:hypothetical protein
MTMIAEYRATKYTGKEVHKSMECLNYYKAQVREIYHILYE